MLKTEDSLPDYLEKKQKYNFLTLIDNAALVLAYLMGIGLFFYYLNKGVIYSADSQSYIQNEIIRSPLYPLLLNGFESFFGKGNFHFLPLFQLSFGFLACFSMANFIKKIFKLPNSLFLVILGMLLSPYTFYFGNLILSEGLAYPLFLITIQLLLGSLLHKEHRFTRYGSFLLFLSLLILTRRQYLFLYVVGFLVLIYLFYYIKGSMLTKISLLFAFVATISATHFLEKTYQYYYNGHFTTVPFVGLQIMTLPLYLSSDKDIGLYSDPREAAILSSARRILRDNRYDTGFLWREDEHPEYHHYHMNYNNVSWGTLSKALSENGVRDWMEIDSILKSMYPSLIKAHWKRAASLYFRNIVNNMGGYYNFIFLWVTFLIAGYFHIRNRDKLSMGVFLAILMTFGNYFLVALAEPAMTRYTFSTNIILISMLIVASYYACRNYEMNESNDKTY